MLPHSGAGQGGLAALAVPRPDILISGDGHNVAMRGKDGRLHLMRTTKDAFLAKQWLAADARAHETADGSLADGISCDDAVCVTEAGRRRLCRPGAARRRAGG